MAGAQRNSEQSPGPAVTSDMSLAADTRQTARALLKQPGLAIIAVLALTLGIGLTTMMFSIIQGAFLRGLPFDNADRIAGL